MTEKNKVMSGSVVSNSSSVNGTVQIIWDSNLWRDIPNIDLVNDSWKHQTIKPEDKASKADIERLEREIRDLRKVLTELTEILGGKVEEKDKE